MTVTMVEGCGLHLCMYVSAKLEAELTYCPFHELEL